MSSDGRYYSITLEPDRMTARPGVYEIKFSTGPGMSTTITDLRMADLDALARVLNDRSDVTSGERIVAAPRPPHPGEPCAHCGGAGSGCHCDIEYF